MKRNVKGQFSQTVWKKYKGQIIAGTVIALSAIAYLYSTAEAHESYLELPCAEFAIPVPCDDLHGFSNFEIKESDGWIPSPHAYEIQPIETDVKEGLSIEDKIRNVFGKDADDAIEVFKCESGLRPDAVGHNTNGSVDVGIAQINSVHGVSEQYLINPDINLLVAKQIFDKQGWNPWVCKYVLAK